MVSRGEDLPKVLAILSDAFPPAPRGARASLP